MSSSKFLSSLATALLALSCFAAAQGSGGERPSGGYGNSSPGTYGGTPSATPDRTAYLTTHSVTGKITAVSVAQRRVRIEDQKGNAQVLQLASETRFKVDKKVELAKSVKSLSVEDLQLEQQVRALYRDSDKVVLEMKLLPPPQQGIPPSHQPPR